MAFSYGFIQKRNINAYLIQSTLGNILIWITDSSAIRRHADWKLYQSNLQYTRRHESSIPLWELPILQLTDLFHLSISLLTKGHLFYLRIRIRCSLRRFSAMSDIAALCVITFYVKSVSTHFFNILLLTFGFHLPYLKKMLEIPSFSWQIILHLERTLELLRLFKLVSRKSLATVFRQYTST